MGGQSTSSEPLVATPEVRTAKAPEAPVKAKGPTFSPEWRFQGPIAWRDTDLNEKTFLSAHSWVYEGLVGEVIP